MAQELSIDGDEAFRCPLRSGEKRALRCYPKTCALGRSFETGTGVTRWYCALNAPMYSESNCYVEEKR